MRYERCPRCNGPSPEDPASTYIPPMLCGPCCDDLGHQVDRAIGPRLAVIGFSSAMAAMRGGEVSEWIERTAEALRGKHGSRHRVVATD